jgi:hypothetical protein
MRSLLPDIPVATSLIQYTRSAIPIMTPASDNGNGWLLMLDLVSP